jgi:hypothetical protein
MPDILRKTFKITIDEIRSQKEQGSDWLKVADTGNERDGGPQYASVPCEKVVNRSERIFEQTVDSLDISAVIAVINGLSLPGGSHA